MKSRLGNQSGEHDYVVTKKGASVSVHIRNHSKGGDRVLQAEVDEVGLPLEVAVRRRRRRRHHRWIRRDIALFRREWGRSVLSYVDSRSRFSSLVPKLCSAGSSVTRE